ncbi:ferritin-like domain-containing protein [Desulfosediminicola sp.]|uniref:ferritin-like domain-containing protein n=1 Tax=Desulfosediminicola sp. TaxID=2886825 RepID=UPI003AF2BDE2
MCIYPSRCETLDKCRKPFHQTTKAQGGDSMNVQKIYEYALQREKEGYQFFKSNADKSSHATIAAVFTKLAEEELKHIEYIQGLLSNSDEKVGKVAAALEKDGWFEGRAQKELLDQTLIESMIPDVAVLRTAYLIEKDLSEFYSHAAEKATGNAKQALSMLAKWERGHEVFFKELHDKIFQEYTEMPWGG